MRCSTSELFGPVLFLLFIRGLSSTEQRNSFYDLEKLQHRETKCILGTILDYRERLQSC